MPSFRSEKNLIVEELAGDDYTFGQEKMGNDDRIVLVEGAVKSGVLSLNTSFKVTSKRLLENGCWQSLRWMISYNMVSSCIHLEIVTDIDSILSSIWKIAY